MRGLVLYCHFQLNLPALFFCGRGQRNQETPRSALDDGERSLLKFGRTPENMAQTSPSGWRLHKSPLLTDFQRFYPKERSLMVVKYLVTDSQRLLAIP